MAASKTRKLKRLAVALNKEYQATPAIVATGENYVEGWISPAIVDRDGDYIPPDEWDLTEHEKNPVALYNHDRNGSNSIPVGKWQHPDGRYSVEVRPDGLYGRCYFDMADPFAAELHRKYKSGVLRGFSPGFIVKGTPQRGTVNGQTATIQRDCKVFEISLVPVPANPGALATLTKAFNERGAKIMSNTAAIEPKGDSTEPVVKTKAEGETSGDTVHVDVEAEETPVTGLRAYLEKMSGIGAVVAAALGDLTSSDAEPELIEKAKACLKPIHTSLKSLIKEVGTERFPDMPWDECAKAIDDAFGLTDDVESETESDEGDDEEIEEDDDMTQEELAEAVKSFVADAVTKAIEPLTEKIQKHDEAIEAVAEVVEAMAS